jgi:hypothetical protein
MHPAPRLFALLATAVACTNPFAGTTHGIVRVHVSDQAAAPMAGVSVEATGQSVTGSEFMVGMRTAADGSASLPVQVGNQTVTVIPPAGYTAGSSPSSKVVTVEANRTVDVAFVLTRTAISVSSAAPLQLRNVPAPQRPPTSRQH